MIDKTCYSLTQHLKTSIPSLLEVELFSGQYTDPSENEVQPPAVYIAFDSITFESLARNQQIAKATITLHLCQAQLDEFDGIFQRTPTNEVFNLINGVHQAIQGWRIKSEDKQYSSAFNRTAMAQISGYEPLQVWTITYEAELYEERKEVLTAFKLGLKSV